MCGSVILTISTASVLIRNAFVPNAHLWIFKDTTDSSALDHDHSKCVENGCIVVVSVNLNKVFNKPLVADDDDDSDCS